MIDDSVNRYIPIGYAIRTYFENDSDVVSLTLKTKIVNSHKPFVGCVEQSESQTLFLKRLRAESGLSLFFLVWIPPISLFCVFFVVGYYQMPEFAVFRESGGGQGSGSGGGGIERSTCTALVVAASLIFPLYLESLEPTTASIECISNLNLYGKTFEACYNIEKMNSYKKLAPEFSSLSSLVDSFELTEKQRNKRMVEIHIESMELSKYLHFLDVFPLIAALQTVLFSRF